MNKRAEPNSAPTVKEIATYCGVSEATVSRVLNNNYKHGFSVRQEIRQRITEVAEAMGYRPNLAAKNLARKKTKMVAILGSDIVLGWPGNIYQIIINACVQSLHSSGYDVCISVPNPQQSHTELPNWKVDGAIVMQECSAQTIEAMERTHLAYVVVNGLAGPCGSSVIPDDIEATRRALGYLIDLGHRRIAYAGPTGDHRKHKSIEDRHETYLSELSKRGLEPIEGHDTIFHSAPAFLATAILKHRATAILAYDHVEALMILHAAHLLDIQIPKQVSLICFNDEYLCSIVTPALTTISIQLQRIGRVAAEELLNRLTSPADYQPKCIKLPQELTIRASTAPPQEK